MRVVLRLDGWEKEIEVPKNSTHCIRVTKTSIPPLLRPATSPQQVEPLKVMYYIFEFTGQTKRELPVYEFRV